MINLPIERKGQGDPRIGVPTVLPCYLKDGGIILGSTVRIKVSAIRNVSSTVIKISRPP